MDTPFGNTPLLTDYRTYGALLGGRTEYLLDKIQGGKMALSVRKLAKDYSGYYARLRRDSDNAEQNITTPYKGYITGNSVLENGSTMTNWLNGSKAYGRRWHDQSGNGAHAEQLTATLQFPLVQAEVNYRPAFSAALLSDGTYFYNSAVINPYLYGPGKKFTFQFVVKSSAQLSSDMRIFYQANTNNALIGGIFILLKGSGLPGRYKITFTCGDLTSTALLATVNSFDNKKPYQITFTYDGSVATSWTDRLRIYVNGLPEATELSQMGGFPADISLPTPTARLWSPATGLSQGGCAEIILWDRVLSATDLQTLFTNTKKTYGLL